MLRRKKPSRGSLNISVCITTLNEETTITELLDSLLCQTKVPDEIVIIDGGSMDGTIGKIKRYKNIRLIISKGVSIAKGRNIAIRNARYPIIAMTDAGCICDKHWLARITKPFNNPKIGVVAGFYEMTGKSDFQKALKPFLGILPSKFDKSFLPSTRSVAFEKSVWKKVGGFSEKFDRAGEDTYFNYQITNSKFQIERVKSAIVYWEVPGNLLSACRKFFYYARGDAQSGNLISSHNIKVLTIFLRYLIFMVFPLVFFLYLLFPLFKFRKISFDWRQRLWTVIIQLASDVSVMLGFFDGIL